MSVTLSQVAKEAGVSVSVASRSLNGRAKDYRISEATESRVKRVADRLEFRPSQTARALRSQRTGLIGVVVPDLSNPFFASISRSVALQMEPGGYSVIVADSREETQHEKRLLKQLESRQVEALVVCPVGTESEHLIQIYQRGTPLVLADRTFPDCDLLQVTSEHWVGAAKATRLLIQKGHRTIGVLQGLPRTLPNEQRLLGHASVLQEFGLAADSSLVAGDNFTEASGYHAAKRLLSQRPDITALFGFSIPNTMGAMRAAIELNRDVPTDLSLIAFDDSPFADLMRIPLTTVRQDVQRVGDLASELVMKELGAKSAQRKRQHFVKTKIVHRNSITRPRN